MSDNHNLSDHAENIRQRIIDASGTQETYAIVITEFKKIEPKEKKIIIESIIGDPTTDEALAQAYVTSMLNPIMMQDMYTPYIMLEFYAAHSEGSDTEHPVVTSLNKAINDLTEDEFQHPLIVAHAIQSAILDYLPTEAYQKLIPAAGLIGDVKNPFKKVAPKKTEANEDDAEPSSQQRLRDYMKRHKP